jgi:hypothetical protein
MAAKVNPEQRFPQVERPTVNNPQREPGGARAARGTSDGADHDRWCEQVVGEVEDHERAKAFWTETLGFELAQDTPYGG